MNPALSTGTPKSFGSRRMFRRHAVPVQNATGGGTDPMYLRMEGLHLRTICFSSARPLCLGTKAKGFALEVPGANHVHSKRAGGNKHSLRMQLQSTKAFPVFSTGFFWHSVVRDNLPVAAKRTVFGKRLARRACLHNYARRNARSPS